MKNLETISRFSAEICLGLNGHTPEKSNLKNRFPQINFFEIPWQGYGKTKNSLAQLASNPWILSLDADEVCYGNLWDSIVAFDFSNEYQIGKIKRRPFIGDHEILHGSWGRDSVLRLYNKGFASWTNDTVHEHLVPNLPTTKKQEVLLDGNLLHLTADNFDTVKLKNDRYASLAAEQYEKQGREATPIKLYLSPLANFISEYLIRLGFLDGKRGWQIAKEKARYTRLKYVLLKRRNAKKISRL